MLAGDQEGSDLEVRDGEERVTAGCTEAPLSSLCNCSEERECDGAQQVSSWLLVM